MNEWEEIGEARGMLRLVAAQLHRLLGEIATTLDRVKDLPPATLEALDTVTDRFASISDLVAWLLAQKERLAERSHFPFAT